MKLFKIALRILAGMLSFPIVVFVYALSILGKMFLGLFPTLFMAIFNLVVIFPSALIASLLKFSAKGEINDFKKVFSWSFVVEDILDPFSIWRDDILLDIKNFKIKIKKIYE